jgi:hypothetical protein
VVRLRPVIVSVLAWCAGAGVAATVGLLALSVVGGDLTREARQALDAGSATAGRPSPVPAVSTPAGHGPSRPTAASPPVRSPTPGVRPSTGVGTATGGQPVERTGTSAGGTVTAVCDGGRARLVYWTPAQGFQTHEVVRGPAELARVVFDGPPGEIAVSVTCADGVPAFAVRGEHGEDEPARDGSRTTSPYPRVGVP